jgi:hypothetical protein
VNNTDDERMFVLEVNLLRMSPQRPVIPCAVCELFFGTWKCVCRTHTTYLSLLINIEIFHTGLVNVIMPGSNAPRIGHPVVIHIPTPVNVDLA